jgi:hypothetical protein
MSNIIPFEAGLPAFLRTEQPAALNQDLAGFASGGFPSISIKGKVFTLVKGDERKIIPNPLDPSSPASWIDVVLIKANPVASKIFYLKSYTEGEDAKKPDCFSSNSVAPDPQSTAPQSPTCALCPHNQWGSGVDNRTGAATKGKRCQDSIRLAVASPSAIKEPFLIRVPPASIRPLGDYGKLLNKRGVSYNRVITKLGFDAESATPKLTFEPRGYIDEAMFNGLQEIDHDLLDNILGASPEVNTVPALASPAVQSPSTATVAVAPVSVPAPEPVAISKDKTVTAAEVQAAITKAAITKAASPVAAPAPVAVPPPAGTAWPQFAASAVATTGFIQAASPAPAPVATGASLSLDDLNFDD